MAAVWMRERAERLSTAIDWICAMNADLETDAYDEDAPHPIWGGRFIEPAEHNYEMYRKLYCTDSGLRRPWMHRPLAVTRHCNTVDICLDPCAWCIWKLFVGCCPNASRHGGALAPCAHYTNPSLPVTRFNALLATGRQLAGQPLSSLEGHLRYWNLDEYFLKMVKSWHRGSMYIVLSQ